MIKIGSLRDITGELMHSRGLFSFALLVVFTTILVELALASGEIADASSEAELYAVEIEHAALVRSEIEGNFDALIEKTLAREISAGVLDSAVLKNSVAKAIVELARSEERIHNQNPSVKFGTATKAGIGYSGTLSEELEGISPEKIWEYSSVLVLPVSENAFLAEFTFTGGLRRNKVLAADIDSGRYAQRFVMPIGYTRRIVAVIA